MSITVTPHLNFLNGEAREALEFYGAVFGGEVVVRTYGDFGMPPEAPDAGRVVFGQVVAEDGFRVMAYDVPGSAGSAGPRPTGATRWENGTTITDQPFFLSLRGETLDAVTAYWERLAVGGTVVEPLASSAWSPGFGMLTDCFGVTWAIDVEPAAG